MLQLFSESLHVELSGDDACATRRFDDVLGLTGHGPGPFVTIAATTERRLLTRSGVLGERGIHAGHGRGELQLNVDFADTGAHGEHRVALAGLQVDGLFQGLSFLKLRGGDVAFTLHAGSLLLSEEHQRARCGGGEVRVDTRGQTPGRTLLRSSRSAGRGQTRNSRELEASGRSSGRRGLRGRGSRLLRIRLLITARRGLLLRVRLLVTTRSRLLLRVLALRVLTLRILTLRVLTLWVLPLGILPLLVLILRSLGRLLLRVLFATNRKCGRAKQGGRDESNARQSDLLGSRAIPSHAMSMIQTTVG